MKIIFLTILRGAIARNVLHNDFYRVLREKYKIVILTPAFEDPEFRKIFGHPNVSFLPLKEKVHTRLDTILVGLHRYLIYNKFNSLKIRYGMRGVSRKGDASTARYYISLIIFKPLSKLAFLRELLKWVDFHIGQRPEVKYFETLIDKHKPDMVISTSLFASMEAALVIAARRKGLKTVGMPKSWDNPSKLSARAKVDILAVWSPFMRGQAEKFQNYRPKNISVIGIPQFDIYKQEEHYWSKERFYETLGLDPNRKIIFFASEGKSIPEDKEFASIMYGFIEKGELVKDCQLLIRPHHKYKNDEEKFVHLKDEANVVIDTFHRPSQAFRDKADLSIEYMERFTSCLKYADVVITTTSTVILDGAAFDKPLINIGFDGYVERKPMSESLRWRYKSDYYSAIIDSGGTTLVGSARKLKEAINRYLKDPTLEAKERKLLLEDFCYKIDGHSGRRFAKLVQDYLES